MITGKRKYTLGVIILPIYLIHSGRHFHQFSLSLNNHFSKKMVKLRLYFLKCNIKAANAKSREQWGREVCSSNMYPMLSDNENWCLIDLICKITLSAKIWENYGNLPRRTQQHIRGTMVAQDFTVL